VRYFFRVEYDGAKFGGWQRQNNAMSIQELLEKSFSTALRDNILITGAGRTDAGVHARAQGAHFDSESIGDLKKCELSVNALLPPEIAIFGLKQVTDDFHARYSAVSRRYRYYICQRKCPLYMKRVWMVFYDIDWELVRRNMTALEGTHDFETFCASGSSAETNICTVKNVSLDNESELWVFTIEADRFIYKMVRSLIGTLVDIGRGRIAEGLAEIISSRERKRAGATAPPFGLVLDNVEYEGVQ